MADDLEDILDDIVGDIEEDAQVFTKPNKFIQHLPNADAVEEGAENYLNEIYDSLTRAVILNDLRDGVRYWCNRLRDYISLYGYRFSKDQHIQLIKLLYELVVTPDIEITVIEPVVLALVKLLKIRSQLGCEDFVLPWRPLYKLYLYTSENKNESTGRIFFPQFGQSMITTLLYYSRRHFCPLTATKEMLDEWRPYMCPFDTALGDALTHMYNFIPTIAPVQYHSTMWKLWIDEIIQMFTYWDQTGTGIEQKLLRLLLRAAGHNVGLINWEPHLTVMFERVLSSFSFPVGPAKYQLGNQRPAYDIDDITFLIVAMITPSNTCMEKIKRLLRSLEPFLHPSNYGSWQNDIQSFIQKLTANFSQRIYIERYKKPSWDVYIPDEAKITDIQIGEFVEMVKPLMFVGLFSKAGARHMSSTMFYLAYMRPEQVIPEHLDNLYQALDNQTNPHRLLATLSATCSVARAMIYNTKYYPDGRLHVIPILQMCLPGIDSNDLGKTLVTLQLFTSLCALLPLADCSEASQHRDDLTDNEQELCCLTAQFQDFIFIYIDRIFSLIDGLGLGTTETAGNNKASHQELVVEMSLRSSSTTLFQQISHDMYKIAFDKIWRVLSTSVYEVQVAGPLASAVLHGVLKANPEYSVPIVMSAISEKILQLTKSKDVMTDERADNTVLWNLIILAEAVRCVGTVLVPFADKLFTIIHRLLNAKNKKYQTCAVSIMSRYMKTLLGIYPNNLRSFQTDLSTPLNEYLPIRDWGKAQPRSTLKVEWHIPSSDEAEVAQHVFTSLVTEQLEFFETNEQFEREDLERRVRILHECFDSCSSRCPYEQLPIELIEGDESLVERRPPKLKPQVELCEFNLYGKNARTVITEHLIRLTEKLLKSGSETARPLSLISLILDKCLRYSGVPSDIISTRAANIKQMKKALEHPFVPGRGHVRLVQVEITHLYQDIYYRLSRPSQIITPTHIPVLKTLFNIATSRYDEARGTGKNCLLSICNNNRFTLRVIVPWITEVLINYPDQDEEKLQGALSLLCSSTKGTGHPSLIVTADLKVVEKLWPALALAQHSEKPKVQALVDKVVKKIEADYETLFFDREVSQDTLKEADSLRSLMSQPEVSSTKQSAVVKENLSSEAKASLNNLISELTQLIKSKKVQWKHQEYALKMLFFLQRPDRIPGMEEMKVFTDGLVDSSPQYRQVCWKILNSINYGLKPRFDTVNIKSSEFSGYKSLQYDEQNLPDSKEKWELKVFIDKTHWGCLHWPREVPVVLPHERPADLPEQVSHILSCFQNSQFSDQVFKYFSQDTNKNNFSDSHYRFFKRMIRAIGPAWLECCKPSIMKLEEEKNHQTEASRQRCIAEFVAGTIRGSNYWSFEEMTSLYDWLIPLIQKCITNANSDYLTPWAQSFSTVTGDRDGRRMYRLVEFLLNQVEKNLTTDGTPSHEVTSRLLFIQSVIAQHEWRSAQIKHKLLSLCIKSIDSPFKSIRSQVASCIMACLTIDTPIIKKDCWGNPVRTQLLQHCLPVLRKLLETENEQQSEAMEVDSAPSPVTMDTSENTEVVTSNNHVNNKPEDATKLTFKTTMHWLIENFTRHMVFQKWTSEIIELIPIICSCTGDFDDPEIRQLSQAALRSMVHAVLPINFINHFLLSCKLTAVMKSWNARLTLLEILQVVIFVNQFTLAEHTEFILEIIVQLLSDDQHEVREVAASTLSGAIQCGFIDAVKSGLVTKFIKSIPVRRRRKTDSPTNIPRLHGNMLGLSAIVKAYPYNVPEFLPEILILLSNHIHQPQPIQQTVKSALSEFKRTHHDNWTDHKLKFTDDQLTVLTDLLVSPNYYA